MSQQAPRLAVVSGGGTGIGYACAQKLLADGCEVVLLGRREAVLRRAAEQLQEAAAEPAVSWHVADVSQPAAVQAAGSWLRERAETVDILVNNAGSPAGPTGPSLAALAGTWMATYQANVVSAVLLTAELEPLLARPGGRVILVSSRAALTGGASPAYAAAKAALHGWLHSLADRLGPLGITANAVAPGYTEDTELVIGRIPPERHARLLSGIAAGRAGRAAEIAAAIGFLASPEASFVNGQVLAVDGGRVTLG